MKKQPSPRGFRPAPDVEERLQYAEKLGLKVGTLVNEMLRDHLASYIEKQKSRLKQALNAPTP